MEYFFMALPSLLVGTLIITSGCLLLKESNTNYLTALKEGIAWGISFLISFSLETLIIGAY